MSIFSFDVDIQLALNNPISFGYAPHCSVSSARFKTELQPNPLFANIRYAFKRYNIYDFLRN